MSAVDDEESSQFADVEFEDAERSLGSAIVSAWYVWVATAISAIFAIVAILYNVTPSPVDEIVFIVTTILLVAGGVTLVRFRWER